MNKVEIDECNKLMEVINEKQARLSHLKAAKAAKRCQRFEQVESVLSSIQLSISVRNDADIHLKDISDVTDSENELKMFLCASEQAKLDFRPASGSLLLTAGTSQDSSKKLTQAVDDIRTIDIRPGVVDSAICLATKLTEHGEKVHLAAIQCAARGGLVKTDVP